MDEYIDKEAFKKSVEERYCKPCKAEKKDHNGCWCRACWVDDMLDEVDCFQPADVAPVVRCKDCKHYRNYPNGLCYLHTEPKTNARGYSGEAVCVEPDDFCSYGERKDDKHEH